MPNREEDLLADIDALIDESLARGDRSDEYHGRRWREEHPCPWCVEGYHYLPITEAMWMMRQGSYATDEFGYGIIDPDYRYEDDTSMVLCPGSEYHGPPYYFNGMKLWDKQSRERIEASARSRSPSLLQHTPSVAPSLPPGRIRRLRFHGPFSGWTIALDDERVMEDMAPPGLSRTPVVREQRLTATFTLDNLIENPSQEWLERNIADVVEGHLRVDYRGTRVEMAPVVIPFRTITIYAENPRAAEPDWVEFETSYPIEERHPWFMQFWIPRDDTSSEEQLMLYPGFEPDYVIIDETHLFTDEELRHHAEEAIFREAIFAPRQTSGQEERR